MALFKRRIGKRAQANSFLSWDDYSERLSDWDLLSWQQETRRISLKNLMAEQK